MSFFNLNEMSVSNPGFTVFNNGIAGKVENVKIDVQKRKPEEPDNYPNYKVVYTDAAGGSINEGFYYWKPWPANDEEQNKRSSKGRIDRLLDIAKAVVPEGFVYPDIEDTGDIAKTTNNAEDILFKIIRDHSDNMVNLYAAYGTVDKPSKYLKPRVYDFIESASNTGYSRLKTKGNDLMEPIKADEPKSEENTSSTDW